MRIADRRPLAAAGGRGLGLRPADPRPRDRRILGIPEELADTFTGWVRDALEFADDPERVDAACYGIGYYLWDRINERAGADGDDLLSYLLHTEVDGAPVDDMVVLGMAMLTMIAGIDTTWSAIGSSLWHLATHDDDRERLVAEPELMDTAVEELLRAYSPVTMARIVTEDVDFHGCPMKQGDKLLMNFPAANRDPAGVPASRRGPPRPPDNRHVAFGSGIHRCAGSNLARMELRVALEEWLAGSRCSTWPTGRGRVGGRPGQRTAPAGRRVRLTHRRAVPGACLHSGRPAIGPDHDPEGHVR